MAPIGKQPEPGARAKRQRVDRAARRARNFALTYWIDGLIRSWEVADLAAEARMCGAPRARLTKVASMLAMTVSEMEHTLDVDHGRANR